MIAHGFSACSKVRVLVIGYGSIGQRHAGLFVEIGAPVTVISRRSNSLSVEGIEFYQTLGELMAPRFDYVIIASETSAHKSDLEAILACDWAAHIPILIEKPLVNSKSDLGGLQKLAGMERIYIGFNMRFLPVVMAARQEFSSGQALIRAVFQSHSYLPHWRPDQDYRLTSSASKVKGGGVLRDLSHELDLMQWFCGVPTKLEAMGGKLSGLEIDVEDNMQIIGSSEICGLISVSLSYTQHLETRSFSIISEDKTVLVDLMTGRLKVADQDGVSEKQYPCSDFSDTYRNMHTAVLQGHPVRPADYQDGSANVMLIDRLTERFQVIP